MAERIMNATVHQYPPERWRAYKVAGWPELWTACVREGAVSDRGMIVDVAECKSEGEARGWVERNYPHLVAGIRKV